jgi:hypothetical protein
MKVVAAVVSVLIDRSVEIVDRALSARLGQRHRNMKRRSLLKAETTSTRMTISTATMAMRERKRTAPLR